MVDRKSCEKCGIELSHEVVGGLCPGCLLAAGVNSDTGTAAFDDATIVNPDGNHSAIAEGDPEIGATVSYFGDYELLDEIARGGMGIV